MSLRTVNMVAVINSLARRAIVLVAMTVAMTAQAQEEKSGDAENAPLLNLLKPGANLIYKDPVTNKVTPLPAFTREMLEDVLKRARLQGAVRLIDLVELKITGEEKPNGFAYLTVELQIRVHAENERVGVAVGFTEFTLRDRIEHVCETPNSWASLETDKLPAKSWILFGKGLHRLTFDLIGQVRATSNGQQRIRIDTPVTPLSSLLLKFHETVESAQLTNGNPADLRESSTPGMSELETWGLADQTEIVWTPKPTDESRRVSVRSTTPAKMTLDLTTDPGSLIIKQPLVISGGSVDHLEVKLPQEFSQVSISGTDADGTSIIPSFHKVQGNSWLIQFSDPITGPITLDYDLGLEKQSYPQDISVNLPDISNATNETGDIELFVPIGLDVKVNRPDEKNTRRIRVESSKGMRTAIVAYRLLTAEARLDLTISETEAFFSVVPQISFETERDEILQRNTLFLTARFKINIARGSLNKMDLKWPNYVSDGWQVVSGDTTRLITESGSKPITGFSRRESPDTFTVVFPERQSGQFEIEIQAFRDLQSVQSGNGILFLPDIVSPTPHTTTVSLIESDADSIVLSRPGAESSFPALPSSRWPKLLKESKKPLSAWLVDSPNEPVQIKITPQKEEVRVRVMTALSIVNDSISVNQVISYDVRHKDHGEIRLVLPDVTPTVRLKGTSEVLSRAKSPSEEAVYSLPAAKRGKFDITVDYFWSPSAAAIANSEQTIRVPIAMPFSTEKQFETLTVATNTPESLLLASSPDWERIHSDNFAAAWQSTKAATDVPVVLQHALEYAPSDTPKFIVLNSAVVGRKLISSVTGVFGEGTNSAIFSVSPNTEPVDAWVNGERAFLDRLSDPADDELLIQVRPKNDVAATGPATVKLVVQQAFDQQHHLFSVCHPKLPVIAGKSSRDYNAIWVLSQSTDQTVFDLGSGMTTLSGNIASRLSGQNKREADAAVRGLLSPYDVSLRVTVEDLFRTALDSSERFEAMAGAVYSENHTIVVVSRRVIFLAAAVLSLILYFVCLKLTPPQLAIVFGVCFVLLAFVVALTSVTVHIMLLQLVPGGCIAVLAAAIQRSILSHGHTALQSISNSEESTIFAVDQPAPVTDSVPLSVGKI